MSDQLVVTLVIKLAAGFFAAFISIILWSKTRDGAWLTMVLGVAFLFVGTLFEILEEFGFVRYNSLYYGEIEILPLVFEVLPYLFFGIGMLIFLIRVRKY